MSSIGFSVLEYRSREDDSPSSVSTVSTAILIFLIRTPSRKLRLLVAPEWRAHVAPQDQTYIADILNDFKLRARFDLDALLKQTCSLAAGPLITHSVGANLAEHPALEKLSRSFIEIS